METKIKEVNWKRKGYSKAIDCLRRDISFNLITKTGYLMYIANEDKTQGIFWELRNTNLIQIDEKGMEVALLEGEKNG